MIEPGLTVGGSLSQRRKFCGVVLEDAAREACRGWRSGSGSGRLALRRAYPGSVWQLAQPLGWKSCAPSAAVPRAGGDGRLLLRRQPRVEVGLGLDDGALAHVAVRVAAQLVALARELARTELGVIQM